MLLRKKKYQEKLLVQTDQQLENLEKLTSDLEFASVEQRVLDGLKTGNEALKKVHEILTVDEIERVLDETNEGIEKQREIDAILNSNANATLTAEDEEDVLAELDALVAADEETTAKKRKTEEEPAQEEEEEAATSTKDDDVVVLPDVPSDDVGIDEPTKPIKEKQKPKQREAVLVEA